MSNTESQPAILTVQNRQRLEMGWESVKFGLADFCYEKQKVNRKHIVCDTAFQPAQKFRIDSLFNVQ